MFNIKDIIKQENTVLNNKGIYLIHSISTGKDYIGYTNKSFYIRWMQHIKDLENNSHHNINLTNIYNHYTINDLVFLIIEFITTQDITIFIQKEAEYINKWHPELNIGFTYQLSLFKSDKSIYNKKIVGLFKKNNKYGAKIYVENKRLILGYFIYKEDAIKAIEIATKYFNSNKFQDKSYNDKMQYIYKFYGFLGKNIPLDPINFLSNMD